MTLADGRTRYRFVIDVGTKPDGKRDQRTFTFDRLTDARAERARIISERAKGSYVRPSKVTLNDHLDQWLAGKRDLKESTRRNYVDALRPVRERFGHRAMQDVTRLDVQQLVTDMESGAARRVGTKGKPLSRRTIKLTLTVLGQALQSAVDDGDLVRNPVRKIELTKTPKREATVWDEAQVRTFLTAVADDRLYAAWLLTLLGMRRGEVLGLRWSDVDLTKGTLRIAQNRVLVNGRVVINDPKTPDSIRTLPLPEQVAAALRVLRARQARERLAAGEAYGDAGDLIVINEIGEPVHPEWYSDRFWSLSKRAGLPRIRLHDARHSTASILRQRGVRKEVVAAWLGHSDPNFTIATYVHTYNADAEGAALTLGDVLTGPWAASATAV
ncbi:tyrosine-type recombinase/integrase [Micromonospora aurantiaca (nom. illeg.)]|uniref:tyrosine-type recombinase/integrase n=1 Tax=Micromonospora aurantiaca (nom. illeg.) TaxID=47850 RepID=UPI00159F2227|nr:tyrosine-type recombinase/integrase [Micromonospora aurantiaca]